MDSRHLMDDIYIFPFITSDLTGGNMELMFIIRKLGHITVYFILTVLILRALHSKKQSGKGCKKYLVAFLIAIVYAISDEYHQSLTGYRDGRWMDVGIDGIGILMGILIYHATPILLIIKKKNRQIL